MWCWWSPYTDAAVFKCSKDEREMLLAADPETFLLHPHYAPHNLILVRAGPDRRRLGPRPPHPAVARRRPETLAEGPGTPKMAAL